MVFLQKVVTHDASVGELAIKEGKESVLTLQRLLVNSDISFDPQALILAPLNVIEISKEIVKCENYIDVTKRGCLRGIEIIENAIESGTLMNDQKETEWISILKDDIASIPIDESKFVEEILPTLDAGKIILSEYGL
jgi:hypothetical protein